MFSQNLEEQYILEYFKDIPTGRFLDVGAYNGKTFSNTHALALLGWGGVCIEASPKPFFDLMNLYKNNLNIELVQAMVIPDTQDPRFILPFYDSYGDAVSTMDEEHRSKWAGTVNYRKIHVKPILINEIYTKFGTAYNFVNVDVEGISLDVALGMDLETPSMLCIEHDNKWSVVDQIKSIWEYEEIYKNGENVILVKKVIDEPEA